MSASGTSWSYSELFTFLLKELPIGWNVLILEQMITPQGPRSYVGTHTLNLSAKAVDGLCHEIDELTPCLTNNIILTRYHLCHLVFFLVFFFFSTTHPLLLPPTTYVAKVEILTLELCIFRDNLRKSRTRRMSKLSPWTCNLLSFLG